MSRQNNSQYYAAHRPDEENEYYGPTHEYDENGNLYPAADVDPYAWLDDYRPFQLEPSGGTSNSTLTTATGFGAGFSTQQPPHLDFSGGFAPVPDTTGYASTRKQQPVQTGISYENYGTQQAAPSGYALGGDGEYYCNEQALVGTDTRTTAQVHKPSQIVYATPIYQPTQSPAGRPIPAVPRMGGYFGTQLQQTPGFSQIEHAQVTSYDRSARGGNPQANWLPDAGERVTITENPERLELITREHTTPEHRPTAAKRLGGHDGFEAVVLQSDVPVIDLDFVNRHMQRPEYPGPYFDEDGNPYYTVLCKPSSLSFDLGGANAKHC
ncbi:hypothetical protein BJ508DRAFT_330074 [Ascobolus immersus RN42]|uniref:Uncharacterized protein n=1 Tax=Ascobolus immersus RN42 TaxID=1160509 RepID=A0A3N4HV71_ASCIM|nr:hypothetical protein BJ508DRAFT_330074 [Ascobolus immersus RN42]